MPVRSGAMVLPSLPALWHEAQRVVKTVLPLPASPFNRSTSGVNHKLSFKAPADWAKKR